MTVEIAPFLDTGPVCQAKIMELDLIPPPSEWKDVFYRADDDFTPGVCIEAKSGVSCEYHKEYCIFTSRGSK